MAPPPNLAALTWDTPAMKPPKGSRPNFDNPQSSLEDHIVIVNSIAVGLMFLVFLIRMHSKLIISRQKFDMSDFTICVAVLGSIAHSVLCIYNSTIGFGRHMWDIRVLTLTPDRTQLFSTVEVIYVITIYFVKISLLLLFLQFFRHNDRSRYLIQFGLAVCTIISIPYLVVAAMHVSSCNGLKALTAHICKHRQVTISNLTFATLNVVTDFYVLVIPVRQLWNLHISTKKKVGVLATFLAGFIASSMSIIRLGFLAHNINNNDALHTGALMSMLGTVEMKLAIICGCVIYLPAFVKQGKSSLRTAYGYMSGHRSELRSSSGASDTVATKSKYDGGYAASREVVESKKDSGEVLEPPRHPYEQVELGPFRRESDGTGNSVTARGEKVGDAYSPLGDERGVRI
ncbi:hypothetical protein BU24DRAFT_492994 [Aaosphaeria arxii CBS 175.79]|uniref:Rhodopsin domain-containing protein n=1 Tax=Aaosphaeria arxii CBS 175.79 TaxID=1450172 RepID=A0A6A5XNJ5_9PLEO|nr:uncharacterized protein BU24DRAFT_492994 [Aaosphaeria arxii CBS 175.79]KAF2014341.1 hypothetical protein BU24DRAFT_492994 [Aaosphaeria arxii CBS 175.79]